MNLRKNRTPRASQHYRGWRAWQKSLLLPVVGEVFPLTLPFIERAYRRSEIAKNQMSGFPCRFKRSMQHPLVSWSYNNFPRETDLFRSTRLTPSQDCVLGDSDLVGAFSSCFQCNAGSSRVLR